MHQIIQTTATRIAGPGGIGPTSTAGPIVARVGVSIRPATLADVPFIDRLQKAHSRELGFLPTMALEGKVKLGQVLVAEAVNAKAEVRRMKDEKEGGESAFHPSSFPLQPSGTPIGYLIAADRYFKRDEIGYVTQINVLPEFRRHLVAAQLLQAQFDRSAYGCRLYSCWCAQDLKANAFWEAMGFTAIAFRTGSRTKGRDASGKRAARIHLFWQKRVRADDTGDLSRGGTPWWYPAQTGGGELREDRLVFPIPPGTHWRDVLPVVLPEQANAAMKDTDAIAALPDATASSSSTTKRKKPAAPAPEATTDDAPGGGLWFGGHTGPTDEEKHQQRAARVEAKAAAKATAIKIDPRLTTMARELRDRWAEQADTMIALPGKHDVRRTFGAGLPIAATPTTTPMIESRPAMLALPVAA